MFLCEIIISSVHSIVYVAWRNTATYKCNIKVCLCKPAYVVVQIFTGTSVAMSGSCNSPVHRLVVYDSRLLSMVCCTGGGT